jgi:hypothetical protein
MWDDYTVPGGTYRESLPGTPGEPLTPAGHPSRNYRYDVLKEKYADANRDITIDKQTPEIKEEVKQSEKVVPIIESVVQASKEVTVSAWP